MLVIVIKKITEYIYSYTYVFYPSSKMLYLNS